MMTATLTQKGRPWSAVGAAAQGLIRPDVSGRTSPPQHRVAAVLQVQSQTAVSLTILNWRTLNQPWDDMYSFKRTVLA